jgi:hypothetical protein
MANNGGFNDLTNQFNTNMSGTTKVPISVFSGATANEAHLPSVGANGHGSTTVVSAGLRGYSRGSRVSQKSNRGVRAVVGQSRDF